MKAEDIKALKTNIKTLARNEGKAEEEIITGLQAGCVATSNYKLLNILCAIKWELIDGPEPVKLDKSDPDYTEKRDREAMKISAKWEAMERFSPEYYDFGADVITPFVAEHGPLYGTYSA